MRCTTRIVSFVLAVIMCLSIMPQKVHVIRAGKATSRNAINLLQLMGFDQRIVDKAHNKARGYLETGTWKV